MTRVLHVIAEYSAKEAMGRTVRETAARVPGEHHLVTATAHDGTEVFASVRALGGAVGGFPLGRVRDLRAHVASVRPDVVHLHAGALGPLLAVAARLPRARTVLTLYAWPVLPAPGAVRRAGLAAARASNVLQVRTALTTVLPSRLVAAAVRRSTTTAVLSPDTRVRKRLARKGIAVTMLPSGAPDDARRASYRADAPTIVFAGRAESVRGVDTLLDALPAVLHQVPDARLRLLLIPRPELGPLVARVAASEAAEAVEVVTEPVPDLLAELVRAQVGVWPFKFDYTTSPPAMAVVEALSVGLPVVATDVACIRAAVPDGGAGGVLVRPGDPAALAARLVEVLADKDLWHRMAAAGPRSVGARLGWHRTAEVTEAAYRALA